MSAPRDPVDVDQLVELYLGGCTMTQVGVELGISLWIVRDRLRERGIPRRGKRVQDIDAAVAAYVQGGSLEQSGCVGRMSAKALAFVLKQRGIRLRERGEAKRIRLPRDLTDTAMALYRDGSSHRTIAQTLHSSAGVVRLSLIDAGVTPRDRGSAHRRPGEFGRFIDPRGYVHVGLLPDHVRFDMTNSNEYVLEHRLTMALALGRSLSAKETVHHIDGRRDNNALSNLQLRSGHHGQGIVLICCDCGSNNIVPDLLPEAVSA